MSHLAVFMYDVGWSTFIEISHLKWYLTYPTSICVCVWCSIYHLVDIHAYHISFSRNKCVQHKSAMNNYVSSKRLHVWFLTWVEVAAREEIPSEGGKMGRLEVRKWNAKISTQYIQVVLINSLSWMGWGNHYGSPSAREGWTNWVTSIQ